MEEDISNLSINSHPPMHTSTPYSSAQSSNKKRHLTRVRIEMSNDSMSSPLTKKKGNPIKHSIESESSKEDLKENKKSQFLSSSDEDGFLTEDEDVQQKNVSKILSIDHEDVVKCRNRILSEEDVRDKPIGQRKAKRLVDYEDEDDDGPADDIVNDSVVEESGNGKVKRDEEESSGSSADDDQNSIIDDESPSEDDGNDFSIKEEESSQSKAEIEIVEDSEEMKNTIQIDDTADEVAQIPMKQKSEEKFPTKKLNNRIEEIKIASKNTRGPAVITPPKVDPTHKPIQLPPQHGRLFGGQMTDERLEKIKYITNDMISAMHKSLSTIPENITTESPKGMRIDLMPHQKHGLTWLLWREQQIPPSGILADDMGLGKTLSMISLILHKKNLRCSDAEFEENEKIRRKHYIQNKNLTMSHGTLVIAPASLIYQWEKEVRDRVKEDKLRVHVFHGPKNKRDISSHRLAKYDIVITTYDLLVSEFKSGPVLIGQSSDESDSDESGQGTSKAKKKGKKKLPKHTDSVLAKIAWERVILDEAHEIRNRQAQKSKACCRLEAVHRWCLTGTPIHNKLWDLYSLVRFMRITPFNEEKMWKEYIDVNSNSRGSTERLNTIVKSILLRRTKNQICAETNKPIVDLQPRTHEIVKLDLQGWEKHCYSIMFEAARQKVKDLLHEANFGYKPKGDKIINPFTAGGKMRAVNDFQAYSCILTLMLRLRQACVHMSLTKHAVDLEAFKEDGADIEDKNVADEIVQNVLEMSFAQMSLDADGIEEGMAKNKEMERIFEKEYPSAKVMAILSRLDKIIQAGDKCVIVSQWTSMLSIIEYHLRQKKITFTSITGEVKTDDRQSRLDNFNRANSGPIVMLLSLTAGGVGLNLIGGNHLFMVDLHWNPALEQQACDRIYRLGQKKSVFIHKFICNSTIEQRVLHIQEKKMAMSKSVLEGSASNKLTKLTREELKFLFELDRRPPQPEKINPAAIAQPGTSKMNPN